MNRVELNRLVAGLLPKWGGSSALLTAVFEGMKAVRGLPSAAIGEDFQRNVAQFASLLQCDDALGQIYQAINSPDLEKAYRATARQRRKFTAAEIPTVTQLFTPKWVVEFLLHNTLGRLWRRMHPDSRLTWDWLVETDDAVRPAKRAIELRICDPACGTMNFGLVAVEMLRQMYREEIDRAKDWGEPSCSCVEEIDACIIANNLFGFDIDPTAIDLARESLLLKTGEEIAKDHLRTADALFDSMEEDSFDIVVTNPPYLSARNLDAEIVAKLKKNYPSGWRDYYACFLLKSLELLRPAGLAGVLCMHSFMFTAAFEKLRRELARQSCVATAAHFGPGLFGIGNPGTLQTVAMVLEKTARPESAGVYFRLVEESNKESALRSAMDGDRGWRVSGAEIAALPRSAWMYWLSPRCRKVFADFQTLGQISPPRQGLATTDNLQFVRYWWEVQQPGESAASGKWVPYAKGGRFRRWYESPRHRVNWEDDGRLIKQAIVERYPYLNGKWSWVAKNSEYYGRPGITYSYLSSGQFSARLLDRGVFFDVAGSALFPDDSVPLLGILNSSSAAHLLSAINPTINFQVGDLSLLPIPRDFSEIARPEIERATELTRTLDRFDETSPEFVAPPAEFSILTDLHQQLCEFESRIHVNVSRMYGLEGEVRLKAHPLKADEADFSRRWVSFAMGILLGRWGATPMRRIVRCQPADDRVIREIERMIQEKVGTRSAKRIFAVVGGVERFLAREFLPWHNRLYRRRPVFWGFSAADRTVVCHADGDQGESAASAFAEIDQRIPARWRIWKDDPISVNLAPLHPWIADRQLQKHLKMIAEDMLEGRLEYFQTARWMTSGINAIGKLKAI